MNNNQPFFQIPSADEPVSNISDDNNQVSPDYFAPGATIKSSEAKVSNQSAPVGSDAAANLIRQRVEQAQVNPNNQAPATPGQLYNPYRVTPNTQEDNRPKADSGQTLGLPQPSLPQPEYSLPANQDLNNQNLNSANPVLANRTTIAGVSEPHERTLAEIKEQILKQAEDDARKKSGRYRPLFTAIIVGTLFLLVNYNQVAIAQIRQYISPGSSISTPEIFDPDPEVKVGPDPRIIIPRINVDVPVVYDVQTYDERTIQKELERGVVHYGTTALPGQIGNNVIVGHSSNNFLNSGKYKFAFVLLDRLEIGDTFVLNYQGQRYIYKVTSKRIVKPDDFSVIQPTAKPTTTLITCTPPGTSWQRLVVQAEQISPNPAQAKKVVEELPSDIQSPLPSNAPSLWSRLSNWLFN